MLSLIQSFFPSLDATSLTTNVSILVCVYGLTLTTYVLLFKGITKTKKHPLLKKIKPFFFLFFLTFPCIVAYQYMSIEYYIFEEAKKIRFVLIKRCAIIFAWITGLFLLTEHIASWGNKAKTYSRITFVTLWSVYLVYLAIDANILYYSGLHISPTAISHIQNGWKFLIYWPFPLFLAIAIVFLIAQAFVYKKYIFTTPSQRTATHLFFSFAIAFAFVPALSVPTLDNTYFTLPERLVYTSFNGWWQTQKHGIKTSELPEEVFQKLQTFGIHYDRGSHYLVNNESITSPEYPGIENTSGIQKPNIIIVFLESYSSRLTNVYNPNLPAGVTPGLNAMATHENTTVFHNFYNASTPTATGILSLLCSHYPTTSHLEIGTKGIVSGHRLLCLPEVLKNHARYGHTHYITPVSRYYSSKDRMFGNMGVDHVWGHENLAAHITGERTGWGYSDHQVFPAFWKEIQKHEQDEKPFLIMLSTIDTHPPFTFPKDGVAFEDGQENILDTFHTTDHAFQTFWDNFIESDLSKNTILIAMADHAVFPNQKMKEVFPDISDLNYYDENILMAYWPESHLPKKIDTLASGVDFTPTMLDLLDIDVPNSFEGHSIFGTREAYPNIIGTHDLGIYINQTGKNNERLTNYAVPTIMGCPPIEEMVVEQEEPLTTCELYHFYNWKKQQFQAGRFWKKTRNPS